MGVRALQDKFYPKRLPAFTHSSIHVITVYSYGRVDSGNGRIRCFSIRHARATSAMEEDTLHSAEDESTRHSTVWLG